MVQNDYSNFEIISNNYNFQKIQDCLSEASDLAMLTVDYQGNPLTQHSSCSEFCAMVRATKGLNDLCRKCDSRGGLEATRLSKPYIYRCHMGILDFAMPIDISGQYFGAILAGQVVLQDVAETNSLEKIVESSGVSKDLELQAKLNELYSLLPVMTLERVQVVANMTFKIANYIIKDAMLKKDKSEKKNLIFTGEQNRVENEAPIIQIKIPVYNSPILKPALDYIQSNFEKKINLDQMADLCKISPSYFSKLFNKIVGDTFANYINLVRIEKACRLLAGSSMSVTVIALDMGFEDNSYFNQVFKRLTGMTPTYYRAINRTRAADCI